MWEQIRANKRKSFVLVVTMALLLAVLGFVIGEAVARGAGMLGLLIAGAVWLVMALVSYFQGGRILMAASAARRIQKQDYPQLFNVVEEMQIAAGLSKMPEVYIIEDMSPNAFATGRDPDHAAVAVTSGLLVKLNRDQLQGVIAHEISHITNRDVLFMTMLGVMLGAIVMVSEVFLRGLFYGSRGSRRGRSSSKGGGQAQVIFMIVAVVLAILAPILARLIYFAASRRREYLADANAAVLTRYPEGLASALEAISGDPRPLAAANRATAPMYISNPLQKGTRAAAGMFTTHPPIQERVRILRGLGGTVSYADYQRSWSAVSGKSAASLPASALAGAAPLQVRDAAPEPSNPVPAKHRAREVGDVLRRLNGFQFIPCSCGLRIKLPPGFKGNGIRCPRCRKTHPTSPPS